MTRINVGYPVEKLTDKHLLSEHREIKRIPNMIKSGRAKIENIPEKFCLGKGHVKFFYNKLGYLLHRYLDIYKECRKRGFKVEFYGYSWIGTPPELSGNYTPTADDKKLIIERINSKLNNSYAKQNR